jgi:hypothetical protein
LQLRTERGNWLVFVYESTLQPVWPMQSYEYVAIGEVLGEWKYHHVALYGPASGAICCFVASAAIAGAAS